jgi:hypothetical protein
VSNLYHSSIAQPYRIQKRLALNQCFRAIREQTGGLSTLVYVTFGGQDLYDTMDLLAVFDLTQTRMRIVSYERDGAIARQARACPVFQALSRIPSLDVRVISATFPNGVDLLQKFRANTTFVYFLDYTGTFGKADSRYIHELLTLGLIREEDFLLITSCLSPRIVHQSGFMSRYASSFQLFFQRTSIDTSFKARNHVDLLLAMALSDFERSSEVMGQRRRMHAELLRKYKYADSQSAMGLWLYRIQIATTSKAIPDRDFDEFPHAFATAKKRRRNVPKIFE